MATDRAHEGTQGMRTDTARRVLDIVGAAALLVLTLPVLLVAIIGTTISLRAWPFFTQTRIGRDGKPFRFVKLRTLPVEAPRYAAKYDIARFDLPRFTRALRLLHLDELPQLVLVLVGKMSLVGPRPEMPYLHEQLPADFAALRTSVRPGCTGLWQVSEHCDRMIFEHPEADIRYVQHRSLRFDLWIMARTVRLLVPGLERRLVRLDDLPPWATATVTAPADPALDSILSLPQPVEV